MNTTIPRLGDLVLTGIIKTYLNVTIVDQEHEILYSGRFGDMPMRVFECYMGADIETLSGGLDKKGDPSLMIYIRLPEE